MKTAAIPRRTAYARGTAIMQVDPAVRPSQGRAVESISGASPAPVASCAGRVDLEWVPDQEEALVPDEMLQLCRGCQLRPECLSWAAQTRSEGYWGGLPSRGRRELASRGQLSPADADQWILRIQAEEAQAARRDAQTAIHAAGLGSLRWYRREGCRCGECRAANARNRAQQRARARAAEVGAAARAQEPASERAA